MIDLLLVLLVVAAGVLGWSRGGAIALAAAACFLLTGLLASVVAVAIGSPYPAFVFLLGGLVGTLPIALRSSRLTEFVEERASPRVRLADRIVGVTLNTGVAIVLAWYVAAIALVVPGNSGALTAVRTASIMGALVDRVPPQGTLGALVLRSGFLPAINGPIVIAQEPNSSSVDAPPVQAARASVVQVRGIACNQLVSGTAWVAAPGLLVTNAHVVAGEQQTTISGGPEFEGVPVIVTAFDPVNDLAVLAVDRPLPPALPLAPSVVHGADAAVIGFPFGRAQRVVAARVDRVVEDEVTPVTGGPPQAARVFAFRGDVEPGNSGGPVLDLQGRVLAIVVAKGIGQRVDAGYGVAAADLGALIAQGSRRVPMSTGDCIDHEA